MKDLFTGLQMLFTELQNFAAFKSYRILKFGKLVESLIKKDAKIEFLDFFTYFGPRVYPRGSLVIAHVRWSVVCGPWSVRWSVRKYLREY